MFSEFLTRLSEWDSLDTWIALTAALSAMACALPGNYLLLRRHCMMGDALSHTVLPGIVIAFLFANWLKSSGWLTPAVYESTKHIVMFSGAVLIGVMTAWLTEWIQKLGRVENSAALGVVFTVLFALGLLLLRLAADSVHIDPDCVLFGSIETIVLDTYAETDIPRAAVVNSLVLLVNALLVGLFYKELRICAFDSGLATTLGINARLVHYALMGATAVTLVAAFESVGSILVISMLIVPAATAHLLTDRLSSMLVLSLVIAALSAVGGHLFAITLPSIIFSRLGFETVDDAGTAGMMAATCGLLFVTALLCAPRHGILSRIVDLVRLRLRIASEDLLGLLYRLEEMHLKPEARTASEMISQKIGLGPMLTKLAVYRLMWSGKIVAESSGYRLTDIGRKRASKLVRSHRLWESYMAKHLLLANNQLHQTASHVEHFIDPELREKLDAELDQPDRDPHGQAIPPD